MTWLIWIRFGAFFACLAVILGAFGAHALKGSLSAKDLGVFETGVRYQMYHGLGLIGLGLINSRLESALFTYSGITMIAGIFLFSGSLYLLSALGMRYLGIVTPIGGVFFIASWILLIIASFK